MTTAAQLGMVEPVGSDLISTGDDDIAHNARRVAVAYDALALRADNAAWYKGDVPVGLNLNTHIEVGTRQARTSTLVNSMVGLPVDATTNPLSVTVERMSSTNGVYLQTVEQYSPKGPLKWERLSLGGTYQAFKRKEEGWYKGIIGSGANLGSFFTIGLHSADTSAIVGSLTGLPADATTHPLDIEVRELSSASGVYLQTVTQWSLDGPTAYERISLSKVYGAYTRTSTAPKWRYGADTYFYGDSLVEQGFPSYVTGLAGGVVNRGRSGDTSNDVLLRAGIIKFYALPVGGSIPASGLVSLDVLGRKLTTRDDRPFTVWWAGIAGTLRHVTGDTWTFNRHVAGAAVPMTKPTPFDSVHDIPDGVVAGFFFGTNDAWHGGHSPDGDLLGHITGNYRRAIESVAATPERHVLVFGMITSLSTAPGSDLANLVRDVNAYCENTAPNLHVSMQGYMVNHAMSDMGLTPTPEDDAAVSAGLIPPVLYVDDLHLTQAAQQAFAVNRVKPTIQARGWA